MKYILDLFFMAILVLAVIIGRKKGFFKLILSLMVFGLSLLLAYTFATPAANFINDRFVAPKMEKSAVQYIEGTLSFDKILPSYVVKNAEKLGLDISGFRSSLTAGSANAAHGVVVEKISPTVIRLLTPVTTVILFILLSLLLSVLAKLINGILKSSALNGLNRLFGAVLGGVNGVLIITAICLLLSTLLVFKPDGFLFFTPQAAQNSYGYQLFLKVFSKMI